MFILKKDCKTAEIVEQMYNYMIDSGLKFRLYGNNDSSPYAILNSGTSIGYRVRSKWNKKGIVFFCTENDMKNIVDELNLVVDDNSTDSERPYAIFVKKNDFEKVVEILKKNPQNI